MNSDYKRVKNIIISTIFLLITGGLLIVSTLLPDKNFSDNENRNLAKLPQITQKNITDGSLGDDVENYAQDHFAYRNFFMSLKSSTDRISGKKDNGRVYFGKNGYLFSIEDIDYKQLEKNISYLNDLKNKIDAYNKEKSDTGMLPSVYGDIRMSVMVVPTATEILKQYLPEEAYVPNESNAIEKIEKEVECEFINTIDILKEKSDEYIYYRTDHHWTTLGAKYAYEKWANVYLSKEPIDYTVSTVCNDFFGTNYSKALLPFTEPDIIERFDHKQESDQEKENRDIAVMTTYKNPDEITGTYDGVYDVNYISKKDKYSYFLAGNNPITIISKGEGKICGTERNILVLKDSYAHCLVPFLTDDFDNIIAVDMRYYKGSQVDLIERYDITDVLLLYNILNFSNDTNLVYLTK